MHSLLAEGQWFYQVPPVSSTNKTDCNDITEILLKVALKHHKTKPYETKPLLRWFFLCQYLPIIIMIPLLIEMLYIE